MGSNNTHSTRAAYSDQVQGFSVDLATIMKPFMSREPVQVQQPEYNHAVETQVPAATTCKAPDKGTQSSSDFTKTRKVCPFWYHYGDCNKLDDCQFLHSVDPSLPQTMKWMPSWQHSTQGCGLALCPMRDGRKKKAGTELASHSTTQLEGKSGRKRVSPGAVPQSQPEIQSGLKKVGPGAVSQPQTSLQVDNQDGQKRKFAVPHRDDMPEKRIKAMDYDDENGDSNEDDQATTCFFWYHGKCSRSEDPRTNYECPFKHELIPSVMVQPPPGYVHRDECDLEWCPGDAKEVAKTKTPKSNSAKSYNAKTSKEKSLTPEAKNGKAEAPSWFLGGLQ